MVTWIELSYRLAQGNGGASQTLEDTKDLLADFTFGKLVQAALALVIAYGAIWGTDKLINWFSERVPRRFRLSIKQSLPFWRAFIFIITASVLINLFLNLSPNNVLAVTGTVAVALGFAFKDYVSSVIAGLIALFETPYQVGDRIQIADHYGEVVGYGLRGVRLQTPDDNIVTIPHNTIWTDPISNANKGALEAQVVTDFYFAHEIDVTQVIRLLYLVAYTSKYTQLKLPVTVIMEEKPWGTQFKLKAYPMDARDEFVYRTDLLRRAKHAFGDRSIAYPHVSAWAMAHEHPDLKNN
ncbi:MAG: mechanosensitive ion channel family protein [Elainellaceae cyanobacterium]